MDFSHLSTYIELAAAVVVGGIAVLGFFNTTMRQRRGEDDSVATNLINNLKLTVDQQKEALAATSTKLDETTKQLHLMQGRNSVLESLFNGSEGSILAFLKQAPELQRIADENNNLAKATRDEVRALTSSIDRLVAVLTPKTTPVTTVTTTTA